MRTKQNKAFELTWQLVYSIYNVTIRAELIDMKTSPAPSKFVPSQQPADLVFLCKERALVPVQNMFHIVILRR
jgi:hypothetical protein